jgi:hypothetical protein
MKKKIFSGLAVGVMMLGVSSAHAIQISSTDAWEYTHISSYSAGTIHPNSDARNMFGGSFGSAEITNTVFNDSSAQGTWHTVQWTLNSAITLGSFYLVAAHDGTTFNSNDPYTNGYRDQNFRGFGAIKLEYQDAANTWQTLYSLSNIGTTAVLGDGATHPVYGGGSISPNLWIYDLYTNVTPTTADTWRVSFEQFGVANYHASGPRILELDGYVYQGGTSVPEPATMLLMGAGLAGIVAVRRKMKA